MNSKNDINNSIIIKLQGGLGNQLFQYALGRSLLLSCKKKVKYDISWFKNQIERDYQLDRLNTVIDLVDDNELRKLRRIKIWGGKLSFLNKLNKIYGYNLIRESGLEFDPNILQTIAPAYIDGHWMSEKYFFKIVTQLREEMRPKDKPTGENSKILEAISRQEAVAVHIRRGDYIQERKTNKFHGTATIDYYQKATQHILEKIASPVFYLFSDDLDWVKENIKIPAQTIFVSQNGVNKPQEDLRLMYSCKHHIIANSTFSWWGAWLNANSKKIVIAPYQWFADKEINTKDLFPAEWIKM